MITVIHLRQSRSERILWLLEELGLDYEVEVYERTPERRAPQAMREIHPLGKSPLLRDGDRVLAESGAIVEYLVTRYGQGRLAPRPDGPDWPRYLFWLHYCEGSLMPWLVLELLLVSGAVPGVEAGAMGPQLAAEVAHHVAWIDSELADREFVAGAQFSAADVMLAYSLGFARARGHLEAKRHLPGYLDRMQARDAWRRARERAG